MKIGWMFIPQLCIAFAEIWLCYQILFFTVLDRRNLCLRDKILILASGIVVVVMLALNRQMFFFSHMMFGSEVVVIGGCVCLIKQRRREIVLKFGLVFIFLTLIALMDFFFAFLSMQLLGNGFVQAVYIRPDSVWPVILFILSRAVIAAALYVIKKDIGEEFIIIKSKGWLFFACIILGIILRNYQFRMSQMLLGETMWAGLDMSCSLLGIMVIIVSALILFFKSKMMQKEKDFLIMKDELLMQKYLEVEDKIEQNRCVIHDLKHDIVVLKEYASSKDYEKLEEYLNKMAQVSLQVDRCVWTQNRLWDLILQQKKNEAEGKGIKFTINSMLVSDFRFDDKEGCALFGNLLDNAIEACEKVTERDKFIEIKIEKQQQLLFLEVANSIEDDMQFLDGMLVSTKPDKSMHGYGLKSVRRIVDKYEGVISFQVKDKVFVVNLTFFDSNSIAEEGKA